MTPHEFDNNEPFRRAIHRLGWSVVDHKIAHEREDRYSLCHILVDRDSNRLADLNDIEDGMAREIIWIAWSVPDRALVRRPGSE